jgi:hypothetical protein
VLQTVPRLLVAKDCVDPDRTMQVLLDYFDRHTPEDLVGQAVPINLALRLSPLKATGVPFQLTIAWIERQERACFRHNERPPAAKTGQLSVERSFRSADIQ